MRAAILEDDDVIMLTNVQIGNNRRMIEREFLFGGKKNLMRTTPTLKPVMLEEY